MPDDLLWQMFTETGDPLCWLYFRAAVNSKNSEKVVGDKPRPV